MRTQRHLCKKRMSEGNRSDIWRRDKRTAQQMRALKCNCSVLARSDGSARFCIGSTTVLASVYGPADVDQRRGLLLST